VSLELHDQESKDDDDDDRDDGIVQVKISFVSIVVDALGADMDVVVDASLAMFIFNVSCIGADVAAIIHEGSQVF